MIDIHILVVPGVMLLDLAGITTPSVSPKTSELRTTFGTSAPPGNVSPLSDCRLAKIAALPETLADGAVVIVPGAARSEVEYQSGEAQAGVSPLTYVRQIRTAAAEEIVGSSQHSMEAIAEVVGFSSAEQMRRPWQRFEGTNPTDQRRAPVVSPDTEGEEA